MALKSKVLIPGLLVSLRTAIKGNTEYAKTVLEEEHVDEYGQLVGSWQTDKVVKDAAEAEAATKVRSKARNIIIGLCAKSDFGYLCPLEKADQLYKAIDDATRLCEAFNLTASVTEINLSALTGQIEANSERAARAIKGELADLLEAMETGLRTFNVEEFRKAANKAKKIATMTAPDVRREIQEYIDKGRKLAIEINKAGEEAAKVVSEEDLKVFARARTAFLDIGDASEVADREVSSGRAVDLDPAVEAPDYGPVEGARAGVIEALGGAEIDLGLDDEVLTTTEEEPARELDLDEMLS